jgi:TolB-like protein/DNA-binding winged helix-turn-helix (wHTH) protein
LDVPSGVARFAEFELDGGRYELRKGDRVLKLEKIPMELLTLLVESNGQLVTRDQIIERIWGRDVFLDTEHGINTAIRKIRLALGDNPEQPRFVQTVTGKGYRFIPRTIEISEGGNGSATIPDPPSAVEAPNVIGTKPLLEQGSPWPRVTMLALSCALAVTLIAHFAWRPTHALLSSMVGPVDRPSRSDIKFLAVLPLDNLSGDPGQEYFADGMTDELITMLAKNSRLRIVSRTSVMQYKGVHRPLPEIARELGVDGILEGSVARAGDRVHMTIQLVHAPSDMQVWAESYDREANDAASLPREAAQAIAKQLHSAVVQATPARVVLPEAHDAYLQGRSYWFAGNYERSKEYFEKAIQLQPDYALAWDGLGDSYGARAVEGQIPSREAFAKEEQYARKALGLDNSLAEAHNSLAAFYFFNAWDCHKAEAESLRAIELNPNYAEARHIHSHILLVMNREEEAIQEQKRSSELDPFARPGALGKTYFYARQYDASIKELSVRAEIQPQDIALQLLLFEAYWFKGMEKEADQHLEQTFAAEGDKQSVSAVQRALERGVTPAAGELFLKQDQDRARKQYLSSTHLAFDYAMLERKEETVVALEHAYRERDPWLVFLQKEPVFDFLHSDERYRALVEKMGLQPAY